MVITCIFGECVKNVKGDKNMINRKKRLGWRLLPLSKRLTPAQKIRRAKRISKREAQDTYTEK